MQSKNINDITCILVTGEGLMVGREMSHTLLILNAGSEMTKSVREALATDGT